jgi:hypothetical protein
MPNVVSDQFASYQLRLLYKTSTGDEGRERSRRWRGGSTGWRQVEAALPCAGGRQREVGGVPKVQEFLCPMGRAVIQEFWKRNGQSGESRERRASGRDASLIGAAITPAAW